ncbi:YcxB family protein [bacterium]|nr:YcxB family protein [bacterium]
MNIEFTYTQKDFKDLIKIAKNNPYFCKILKKQLINVKTILFVSIVLMFINYSNIKSHSLLGIAILCSGIILYTFIMFFIFYLLYKKDVFSVSSKRLYRVYKYKGKTPEHIELKNDYLVYTTNNATTKIYYKDLKDVYNEEDTILAYWWKDAYILIPKRVLKSQKEIDKVLSLLKSGKN